MWTCVCKWVHAEEEIQTAHKTQQEEGKGQGLHKGPASALMRQTTTH